MANVSLFANYGTAHKESSHFSTWRKSMLYFIGNFFDLLPALKRKALLETFL